LQLAENITTVVLDKTGTVTEGKPVITDRFYQCADDLISDTNLIVAAIESHSEHPLARAIAQGVVSNPGESELPAVEPLRVEDFKSHPGLGVSALVDGESWYLGNEAWMNKQGVDCAELKQVSSRCSEEAKSLVYVATQAGLVALFAVADPVKQDSASAISELRGAGLKVILLSGDNRSTAEAIASQVGITEVIAEVKPDQKQETIKRLQEQGDVVAMVGDGVNDAPALAQADLGYAIGSGSDVAIASADVTLISGSLTGVYKAITISKATVRNIKQNLFGAFIYNAISIPIAAGVLFPIAGILLNPAIAGAAMAMSSVTVVSNANRLRWLKV
jgi:Cu+-exporting ATPase